LEDKMKPIYFFATLAALCALAPIAPAATAKVVKNKELSFFITSQGSGDGANLGGLAGADKICQQRAAAVGAGQRQWRAYLSTSASDGKPAINARDRIGKGPWRNATGVEIASNVTDLHGATSRLSKALSITETGQVVNGRGDTPNRHDILTGSQADGTAYAAGTDKTCRGWTSNGEGIARVGHHDRQGGGDDGPSWNSAHDSRGCSPAALQGSGGDGLFYCFAAK
jgi:hypothetical protein